jgi:hypothetical protein
VKTKNPSACATEKWKVCKSAIALYFLCLSVIKRDCNQGANKSNNPNYNPVIFVALTTLQVDNINIH